MIILLPPSEGKAEGGLPRTSWNPAKGTTGRALGPLRHEIARVLARSGGGNQALLGVKGDHLARARRVNSALIGSPTLPAWERYTGVVWDHLDLGSFTPSARARALSSILVPSGVMGLARADDPVPDYRLKMGAALPGIGKVSTFWRDAVTDELARLAGTAGVIDLLPQEHRGAFDWSRVQNVVRVDLVSRTGGTVGGHNAKAAKGLLARHLLTVRTGTTAARVASFTHDGYSARIAG